MTALPFPTPADFVGHYGPRAGPVKTGGQSTYDGTVVVSMLERALVQAILPGDLTLAQPQAMLTHHPVVHLIGQQRDLYPVFQGVQQPIRTLPDYREMILLIPYVVRGTGLEWHNYAARMYLDNQQAVNGGNTVYAYAKELATLVYTTKPPHTDARVAVQTIPFFTSAVELTGAWRNAANAHATIPRWDDLIELFNMPVLGYDSARVLCSYFEWTLTSAEFAPATSIFAFLESFRPGMAAWVALGPMNSAPDGAIGVRGVRWRLASLPSFC
jgi:hypothetical protein